MKIKNTNLKSLVLLAGLSFGQIAEADQSTVQISNDIDQWYDTIRPLSYLSNPEEECFPLAHIEEGNYLNPYQGNKAKRVADVMALSEMTAKSYDAFSNIGGGLCFMDFSQGFANGGTTTAFAMHFSHYNLILINDGPDIPEGCQMSAMIHEMQHAAQKAAGLEAPIRDLLIDDQENLIVTVEADAHMIQVIGAKILATNGYSDADDCNRGEFSETMPRFIPAIEAMDEALESDVDALFNGAAATEIYDSFIGRWDFVRFYNNNFRYYYDCESYPDQCFRPRHSLDDLGIDLDNLSTIHFDEGYRITPYAEVKDEVILQRE